MPRRFRCLHVLLVSIIGAAILTVTIVCVSGKCRRPTSSNDGPPSPASPDTPPRNTTSILEYLNDIALQQGSIEPGTTTPTEKATTWLLSTDTLPLYPSTFQLVLRQRYALASLWFQSEEPWWGDADGWLDGAIPECEWEGVECNDPSNPMEITKLSLCCIHLNGNLPVDLGLLTALTSFDVGRNSLSGTIPVEYSSAWNQMKEFFVGDNDFTGALPSPSLWSDLEIYDVHANKFSEGVDDLVWPTKSLRTVYLYNNTLNGDLSDSLCENDDGMTELARLVTDCDELLCDCCTDCCPNATSHSC